MDTDYIECNQPTGECKNGICEAGEEEYCPMDCGDRCSDGQTGCVSDSVVWDCISGALRETMCPSGQRCGTIADAGEGGGVRSLCLDAIPENEFEGMGGSNDNGLAGEPGATVA